MVIVMSRVVMTGSYNQVLFKKKEFRVYRDIVLTRTPLAS